MMNNILNARRLLPNHAARKDALSKLIFMSQYYHEVDYKDYLNHTGLVAYAKGVEEVTEEGKIVVGVVVRRDHE
jgi:hypothetical protein